MDIVRFAKANLIASIGVVLGAIIAIGGIVMDAVSAYQLGLASWVWAVIGLALFFASTILLLYRFDQRLPKTSPSLTGEKDDPHWQDKLEAVVGKHFQNTEVRLDGKRFIECVFRDVTFIYNGGPISIEHSTVGTHIIKTEREDIQRFANMLIMFGHLRSTIFTDEGVKSLDQVRADAKFTR